MLIRMNDTRLYHEVNVHVLPVFHVSLGRKQLSLLRPVRGTAQVETVQHSHLKE